MRNYPEELADSEEARFALQSDYAALKEKYAQAQKRIAELEALVSGKAERDAQALDDALRKELKKHYDAMNKHTLRYDT